MAMLPGTALHILPDHCCALHARSCNVTTCGTGTFSHNMSISL
jgi:hypothetical protein